MTRKVYDVEAPRRPVNLYLNSDLVNRTRSLDGNLSERVERLLAEDLEAETERRSEEQIQAAIASSNAFIAKYGSFSDEYTDL